MSDGTRLNTGAGGDLLDTEDIGARGKLPRSKIVLGALDTDGGDVALTNPLPVELSDGTNVIGVTAHPMRTDPVGTTTQPVSAASLPLPTGAATDANLNTQVGAAGNTPPALATAASGIIGWLRKIVDVLLGTLTVSGSVNSRPTDGANPITKTFDNDSGVGTEYNLGVSLRKSASGGSVELGTNTDPVRTDPVGTTTQPVSAASLPLPTGAATDSTLSGVLTTADFDTKAGSLTEVAPGTDTASSGLNGRLQRIAQRLTAIIALLPAALVGGRLDVNTGSVGGTATDTNSGNKSAGTLRVVLATDQPALTNKLLVTPDSVALPANQSVNVAQIGGANSVSGGVAGTLAVGGNVATNTAIGTNPVNVGVQGVSSENAAVTGGRLVQLVADLVGKLIVRPHANPENTVNGVTAAIVDTTSTQVIAAQAASVRIYVTELIVTNSHATVGTFVKILDGATIIWEGYAAAAGGGFAQSFSVPLRGTAAAALNAQCVTTGANVIVSANGYKGA